MHIVITDQLRYDEIDSNALSVISLQYRGSWIIEQQDVDQAGIDFPSLYRDINSYDDLRSSKLRKIDDKQWLSYYTPIYPLVCIPAELFLQALNLPQSRTFSVPNAILVIVALCVVNKCLRVSDKQKLFALLLLILNPSIFYINYINYEIFVFSMIIISLTMYYNGHKKRSALFLCAGTLANMALIIVGMAMILDYLIDIVINNKGKSFKDLIMDNWKETVLYAISFLPFFINLVYMNLSTNSSVIDAKDLSSAYIPRLLSYFFDPTLVFFTFAIFETIMYFVLIILFIILKNRKALF